MKATGDQRELARLYGGRAKYAARWKTVVPTETAYRLLDGYYCYSARRDLGLRPTKDRALPRHCSACREEMDSDGQHGLRCIFSSRYTVLRHDSIEQILHQVVRDGIGRPTDSHTACQRRDGPCPTCTFDWAMLITCVM